MFFTNTLAAVLVPLFLTLTVVIIGFFKWRYQYWKRRNLPYLEPKIPYGNMLGVFGEKHVGLLVKNFYDEIKTRRWKHGGLYQFSFPVYLPIDLELLKNIFSKDFQHFSDRGICYNEKGDPLSAHLFNVDEIKWRTLRPKMTPNFTSRKIKSFFEIFVDCKVNLCKRIDQEMEKKIPIDIKDASVCFTIDFIGSCAFGLKCNTFENRNSPFRIFGLKFFEYTWTRIIKRFVFALFPNFSVNVLNLCLMPKDISDFFENVIADMVNYREKNGVSRKDFLQLLIDLKNNKLGEEEGYQPDGTTLTMKELAAQSFLFFIAGFETSSTTMTFGLYELAKNQDLQERLRIEVKSTLAKHGGEITYDVINEMKYLSQVVDETLRKYPAVPLLTRRCVIDYQVPGTDVVIEKGTTVLIPIYAIHHDEEYYPEPEKFDPERFNEENKNQIPSYAYIPFGGGPRNCIGMRFGLMQAKVGIVSLLQNYKFTINERTKEPLVYQNNTPTLCAKEKIWLDAQKI